jgi:hypothetical protein
MKKYLLIFVLLCSMSNSYGQFAPINATWHYGLPDGNGIGVERFMTYVSEKDTSILDETYSVIIGRNDSSLALPELRFYLSQKEDSIFYFYQNERKTLFVLNLKINDTAEIDLLYMDKKTYASKVRIASIFWQKSNLLGTDSLKSYSFEIIGGQTVHGFGTYIEKVISSHNNGILPALIQYPMIPEGVPYLRCYSDSNFQYKFHPIACDFNNVGLNDFSQITKIKVFPNPAKDQLFFEFDSPINENTILSIYNHFGQLSQQINFGLNQTSSVDISNLPVGLYFISLSSDSRKYGGSFIKQ